MKKPSIPNPSALTRTGATSRFIRNAAAWSLAAASALSGANAWAQQIVRIAQLEPLSGPFQSQGETNVHTLQAAVDEFNAHNKDIQFEISVFDAQGKAQEALNIFRQATERGIQYFTGGGSSAIVSGLIEAVNTYNERNPGREVLYLNHQAIDPDFTESRCSFWHFRFDPHVHMRMFALTSYITRDAAVKKVYLINQDYSFGQQVEASAKRYLGSMRPDIAIVGEERHPIGRTKDFAPYVAKIRATGADTVITGNFGQDLVLLIKAAKDAGLNVKFYTYYGNALGAPTAVGAAGVDRLRLVGTWETNAMSPRMKAIHDGFKAKYPKTDIFHSGVIEVVGLMGDAVRKAGSVEPKRVAFALEGLKTQGAFGEVEMRAGDHQLLAPLFIQTFEPVDGKKVKHGIEGLPLGFRTDAKIAATETAPVMACQMKRPSR
ncbi:MAG: branched-chain amino acid ABC transporter substrate-binding protein [Hydrogenophaga sp.]|jgi:branched-chain amino acid transport system substrate-binding protein|nr:branched-chain amino acid ABC transporter substrate-binding protein [Hydrogenophaga sp.]